MKKQFMFTAALAALAICIPVGARAVSADADGAEPEAVTGISGDADSAESAAETVHDSTSYSVSCDVNEDAGEGISVTKISVSDENGQTICMSGESDADLTEADTEELTNLLRQHQNMTDALQDGAEPDEAQQTELDAIEARIDELMKQYGLTAFFFSGEDDTEYSYAYSGDENGVRVFVYDTDGAELTAADADAETVIEDGCVTKTITVIKED